MKNKLNYFFILSLLGCSGGSVKNQGAKNGSLAICKKETQNCVSSQNLESDTDHYITPIKTFLTKEDTKNKLMRILKNKKSIEIVKDEDDYIHVTFKTSFFKFVQDMEFLITDKQIQIRSESRLGKKDFGKNRSTLEMIRFEFIQSR